MNQHCFEVGTIFSRAFFPSLSPPMGPATQAHARTAVPPPMPSVLDALSSPHHPGPAIKDPQRVGLNRGIMWVTRLEVWVICVGFCDIRSPEKAPRSKVVHRPPGQEWAVGPKRMVGCHLVARFMSLDLLDGSTRARWGEAKVVSHLIWSGQHHLKSTGLDPRGLIITKGPRQGSLC